MKPTPEQVEAAKAWTKCDESSRQYALLLGSHTHDSMGRIAAEILLAALEAAEQDSARLDWLDKHKGMNDGNCDIRSESLYVMHAPSGHDYYKGGKNLPLREAIDAARKAQP